MPTCQCGRTFQSEAALIQHRAAKHNSRPQAQPAPAASAQTAPIPRAPPRNAKSRGAQMWKGLRGREPIHTIDAATLQPSTTPVSSASPYELICSYNWQSFGGFQVPGHAPLWQDVALPIKVPKDQNTPSAPKSAWTTTKNPFEQVLQAAAVMSPDFRLNTVDIVTTRNSLRKLLDFCSGRSLQSFRVHISLVRNTLFIEQYDSAFMAFQSTGWGHNFEKAFTRFPPGLEASTTHDRFLRYPIGDLDCVVGFEVDACYEGSPEIPLTSLQSEMEQLQINPSSPKTKAPLSNLLNAPVMPQSTAAEMKSKARKPGRPGTSTGTRSGGTGIGISSYLPQLWFGRTPWLIVGSHVEGTFEHVSVVNAAAHFERWEAERQVELRKLAALLGELREAVRGVVGTGSGSGSGSVDGQRCAVVYERGEGAKAIKIYVLGKGEAVVSDENFLRFWGG